MKSLYSVLSLFLLLAGIGLLVLAHYAGQTNEGVSLGLLGSVSTTTPIKLMAAWFFGGAFLILCPFSAWGLWRQVTKKRSKTLMKDFEGGFYRLSSAKQN